MTLSPPSCLDMTTVPQTNASDDESATTIPLPTSKLARKPDMDDTSPPPVNPRGQDYSFSDHASSDEAKYSAHDDDDDSMPNTTTPIPSTTTSDQEEEEEESSPARMNNNHNIISQEEEDPEAESIALARMLMEQEAIESYGALSADYLRYNANQFSQEDLAALQAAMAEDEGSSDSGGANEQPFSYDVMLRLGESIGDVKKERWNLIATSQISKLPEFTFHTEQAKEKDENDCDAKCLVCQFPYEENEKLRRLPCGHAFHSECVAQWLKDNDICPYCRQTIVVKKED